MIKKFLLTLLLVTSIVSIPAMASSKNGWVQSTKSSSRIYYIDGEIAPSGLIKTTERGMENWYYLNNEGEKTYGWIKIPVVNQDNTQSVYWMYGTTTGELARNRWVITTEGIWYYFDNDAKMVSAPTMIDGKMFNFASDGHRY